LIFVTDPRTILQQQEEGMFMDVGRRASEQQQFS